MNGGEQKPGAYAPGLPREIAARFLILGSLSEVEG